MFSLFVNPWTMAAGVALVSAPIIIHLINRMRFRRVKWAAMEFLLKAQKRMKRKLIIEQLILLLLRCLLVFLVGLLFARYLGFSPLQGKETRATAHVVILDDTPSMADRGLGGRDGQFVDAFEQAKTETKRIADAAKEATTPQSLDLLRLSELRKANPDRSQTNRPDLPNGLEFGRINTESIQRLEAHLAPLRPVTVRVGLADGLRTAREILDAKVDQDTAKVVHVLSDLRAVDWATDGEAIKQEMEALNVAGVKVHLVDVAHPNRREDQKAPPFADNSAIIELVPKARVVARFQPVEFAVRIKNYGNTEVADRRVVVYVNGVERPDFDTRLDRLAPHQEVTLGFTASFDRVGTNDRPLDRFNLVTAALDAPEGDSIAVDNVRHAVVECRERLAVLVVDGRPELSEDKGGDSFYLRKLFVESFGGINWVKGTTGQLDTLDLRPYSGIYLLNVPGVSENGAKNLEAFVREGGGLGVFLGPNVKPGDYNKFLYKDGAGVFPVPLPETHTPPLSQAQREKRQGSFAKRILLRDSSVKSHPAVVGMYTGEKGGLGKTVDIENFFYLPDIAQWWPISRRVGKWREDQSVQELFCMPNEQNMANFEQAALDLVGSNPAGKIRKRLEEPKYEKYRPAFTLLPPGARPGDKALLDQIRDIVKGDDPLTLLAGYLDRLVCDQITTGEETEPLVREFWALPEMADIRAEAQRLRDSVKFGDPLYLVKQFGKGRVAVMTMTAGETWTDWPSQKGSPGWVATVAEMQRYLAGGGVDANRVVGSPVGLTLDPARYLPSYTRSFVSFDPSKAKGNQPGAGMILDPPADAKEPPKEQPLDFRQKENTLSLRFDETRRPGVYLFNLTMTKSATDATPGNPGYLAVAFNVDAQREGDLRRVHRDDVTQQAPGAAVHSPDDPGWLEELKQKQTDLSSNRWIYLIILLVLVAEQAMAVRLSYHTRPEDLELLAPSAASAYTHGAPPATSETAQAEPAPTAT
jgi:hypothetical protein